MNLDPDAAARDIVEYTDTVSSLALQHGRTVTEIAALAPQVGQLLVDCDLDLPVVGKGELRLPREAVRSELWAARAADEFMASHEFPRYRPKNERTAQ
jgi:hypothetical protein